jgi:hypothetical protein
MGIVKAGGLPVMGQCDLVLDLREKKDGRKSCECGATL